MNMELDLLPLNLPGVSNERPLIIAGPCSATMVSKCLEPVYGNLAQNQEALKETEKKPCHGCNA